MYEHLGGTLVHGTAFDDEMKAIVDATSTQDKGIARKKAIATICIKVLATAFIKRSGNRYSALKRELTNSFALGNDRYPTDPTFTLAHFSWSSHKCWACFPTANSFTSLLTTNFKGKVLTRTLHSYLPIVMWLMLLVTNSKLPISAVAVYS